MTRRIVPILLASSLFWTSNGHAARPFVTDDARVVDPGGGQIETFFKKQRAFGEQEFWVLPAYNPGGRVELTLGGYVLENALDGRTAATLAQAKTLLKPLETNGVGYALTVGVMRVEPPGMARQQTNPYLNGIGSFSLADDRFVVHANLGARRDGAAGLSRATWGLGSEIAVTERVIGIVEGYGERGVKPTLHMGVRYWAVPNRVQIDTTVGEERSSPAKRFYTVGMRLLF
jgi:hypothetical protein